MSSRGKQLVYYGDLFSLDGELLLTVPFEELGIRSFLDYLGRSGRQCLR